MVTSESLSNIFLIFLPFGLFQSLLLSNYIIVGKVARLTFASGIVRLVRVAALGLPALSRSHLQKVVEAPHTGLSITLGNGCSGGLIILNLCMLFIRRNGV